MPIYRVQAPDGTILRIEGPEGASAQQLEDVARTQWKPAAKRADPGIGKPEELSFAEKYVAPALEAVGIGKIPEKPVRGLVQGAADPVLGAAQLVLPSGSAPDKAIKKQLTDYEASRGGDQGSFDGWRALGAFLGPTSMLVGGSPATASAMGRIGQGVAMGGISGATNPTTKEDFWGDKGSSTALGLILGGMIPGAWEGAKAGGRFIRNIAQPMMGEEGAKSAAGRLAREVTGDKTDEVIAALMSSKGAKVNAGQAALPAGSAEFSALSRIAESNKPSPSAALRASQQEARAAEIRNIAKTPDDLKAAKEARGAMADFAYGEAYKQPLRADPELARIADNPYFKDAWNAAEKLAEARGVDPKKNLTEYLQFVKEALDVQLAKSGDDALSKTAKETVSSLKGQLLGWLEKKNPKFEVARARFAEDSVPINRMVAGAELEKSLTSGTGKERAVTFTNAVENAARIPELRRKTGAQRFGSLEEILTPDQMSAVRGVAGELKRDVNLEELARSGMGKTSRAVGDFEPNKLVNPLERTVMVINALISRAAGKGSKRTMDALSDLNLDPAAMAEYMQKATPAQRSAIVDALMRAQAAGIGQSQ